MSWCFTQPSPLVGAVGVVGAVAPSRATQDDAWFCNEVRQKGESWGRVHVAHETPASQVCAAVARRTCLPVGRNQAEAAIATGRRQWQQVTLPAPLPAARIPLAAFFPSPLHGTHPCPTAFRGSALNTAWPAKVMYPLCCSSPPPQHSQFSPPWTA